jgi:CRISPR-associated protein Cmr2
MLSYLALTGVEAAEKYLDGEGTFISPVKVSGRWPKDIPNRFLIGVPAGEGEALGTTVTDAIQEKWQYDIAHVVQDFFGPLAIERGWQEIWRRQVEMWPEIYWIAWPQGEEEAYSTAYCRAGLALSARKQIRFFSITPEEGEKCTLCGVRQALHGKGKSRRGVRRFWDGVRERLQQRQMFIVREGERLCTLCSIKRLAAHAGVQGLEFSEQRATRFPSTSSVAAVTFKEQLLSKWQELAGPISSHLQNLADLQVGFSQPDALPYLSAKAEGVTEAQELLRYDGDFFYPESYAPEVLEDTLGREPTLEDRRQAKIATRSLGTLLSAAAKLGVCPPHHYFAVLALDGDRIGNLLGQCEDPVQHRELSTILASFAEKVVPKVVERQFAGRLVYSGGDDVLALLPVDHVLEAADTLQQKFTETLAAAGWPQRTASAGVAIGHRKYALETVLQTAKRAEHEAKEQYGRDALVLHVLRRSGENLQVGFKWSYPELQPHALSEARAPIDQVRQLIVNAILSNKIAYDLRAEAAALAPLPFEAQKAELARLLTRHWQSPSTKKHQEEIEQLASNLAGLSSAIGIEALAKWLLVARFLSQGGAQV